MPLSTDHWSAAIRLLSSPFPLAWLYFQAGLLEEHSAEPGYSRRQAAIKLAQAGGAAVAAPLIYSVAVPASAFAAASCDGKQLGRLRLINQAHGVSAYSRFALIAGKMPALPGSTTT